MRGRAARAVAAGALALTWMMAVTTGPAHAEPVALDMSSVPGAPWVHDVDEAGTTTSSGGVLTLSSPGYNQFMLTDPSSPWAQTVDNDLGYSVSTRLRIHPGTAGDCQRRPVSLWIDDGVLQPIIGWSTTALCVSSSNGLQATADIDTTRFHTYEVRVKGAKVDVFVDGVMVIQTWLADVSTAAPSLTFGDGDGNADTASVSSWDVLSYETTAGCTIVGTPGNDTITGTSAADVICGLGGNDVIDGKQANDVIHGGRGRDTLRGSSNDDTLDGGPDADVLIGGGGNDRMTGGPGDDTFRADPVADGSDLMTGGLGFDTANYGARTGAVRVTLDWAWDDGVAGFEHDQAQPDIERAIGGSGNDTMVGDQPQQTTLWGGAGDDTLDVRDFDGQPTDRIDGGTGTDTCLADAGVTTVNCP